MSTQPWLAHYDKGVPASLQPYPNRTLLDYLADAARESPDRTALLFKGGTMTYAKLETLSNAFAAALQALGVKKGDRVATLLPNSPQFMIAELGAWKVGAILNPLNALYTDEDLEAALKTTEAETIVVLNRFYDKIKKLQKKTSLKRVIASNIKEYLPGILPLLYTLLKEKKEGDRITLQGGDYRMADLIKQHAGAGRPNVTVSPDDPATILMSGGTTGTPKGVLGIHRGMVITGLQLHAWNKAPMGSDPIIMLPLPLFHTYGNTGVQSLALVARAPLSLIPNPRDIADVLATINKVRPTFLCAVPTLLNAIINHPDAKSGKIDFKSIKLVFSGAAALMAETKKRFEEMTGGVISEGYSLTEAQMAVVCNPAGGEKKLGSIGMPLPDVIVKIVDADDGVTELPVGEVGEIIMHAPQLMQGYYKNPMETQAMLRTDSAGMKWLYTGDLGNLDTDGYLFIVDRKKDLIKTSGYQVWPRELEEVIASHPAVAEVGVAGIPDAAKGEVAKAWVILRPGMTATEAELRAYCKEKLTPYKVPSHFEFVTDLPKTLVGKVLRRMLRQQELAKMGRPLQQNITVA